MLRAMGCFVTMSIHFFSFLSFSLSFSLSLFRSESLGVIVLVYERRKEYG